MIRGMDGAADHTILIGALAAGTAIVAALIAAVSADMRQRRQLKHDRQLKDLAEIRSVVDEAIIAFEKTTNQVAWAVISLDAPGADSEDDEVNARVQDIHKSEFTEAMKTLAEHRDEMIVAGRRLVIRIGRDEPLYRTYASAISSVIDSIRLIYDEDRRLTGTGTASDPEFDTDELIDSLANHRTTLVTEAVALVGSRLPGS
jgi:hypothetical protein